MVLHLDDDRMSPAAQVLMKASGRLLNGDKGTQDRLAYVFDALIASPEGVQASLRAVRDGLIANDPALALVKEARAAAGAGGPAGADPFDPARTGRALVRR